MAKAKDIEQAKDLLKDLSFCVFDLETTGGNHQKDKIIEIGLVKIEKLKIVDQKSFLIDPQMKIPEFIQKLTSIKQEDVEGKPVIEDLTDEILEFMGDSILVAHNTSFDVPFFNSVLRRLNRPELENKNICTNLMTKFLIPNLMNSNLTYMSKIFGINHSKAHRALDDAKATAELLLIYLEIFISKNIKKINHLYYPKNRFELDRANFKKAPRYTGKRIISDINQKLDSLSSPYMITVKGNNGVILYALACSNEGSSRTEERAVLQHKLESLDWQTVTIRLYGPFLECLINFNSVFSKLAQEERNEVMNFLWTNHFPSVDVKKTHTKEKDLGDFLIVEHLVPEQYIIYPIATMTTNNRLIFRYPGHKKKLLQYIKSRANKLGDNKAKRHNCSPELRQFICYFLLQAKFRASGVFIFNKSLLQAGQDQLLEEIERYMSKNSSSNNYPKEYI